MSTPTNANGLDGMIMWSGESSYLRVYGLDGTFSDYLIRHCDLAVTITDPDAFIYDSKEGSSWDGILDHSPETLGLTR